MFQLMATSITQTGTRSAACKLVYDPSERRDVYIYIYKQIFKCIPIYIYIHIHMYAYIYKNYINISYILLIQNLHFRTRWCPPITSRFMDISDFNLVCKSSLSIDISTINPTVTVVINQWGRFKHHFSWSNLPFYPLPLPAHLLGLRCSSWCFCGGVRSRWGNKIYSMGLPGS